MSKPATSQVTQFVRLLLFPAGITSLVTFGIWLYVSIDMRMPSAAVLALAMGSLLIASLGASLVILPIAVIRTIVWTVRISRELLPGPKLSPVRWAASIAVPSPQLLTPVGLQHRRKVLESLALASIGIFHGIIAFLVYKLSQIAA